MKTKIIPFDLETAKKIQAGEAAGRITTRDCKHEMKIVCFNSIAEFGGEAQPIIAQDIDDCCYFRAYFEDGHYLDSEENAGDLVLEVPDNEPQFKPFDKVIVRSSNNCVWMPRLYSFKGITGNLYMTDGECYEQVIKYEGNEHLVGTIDKPKEE